MSTLPERRWASTARSASATDWASGFSTKQCLPASRTRTASSAWLGTGVASTTASSSGSASRSSRSPVKRASRNWRANRSRTSARPSQHQRSSRRRQRVEVAREVRAPVAQADDADGQRRVGHRSTVRRASTPRVTPRRSTTSGARSAIASWSTPGWAVTISARSAPSSASSKPRLCSAALGQRGHVRVVVDEVGAERAEQRHDLQRRRLAHVADAGLVADAEDRDAAAVDRLARVVEHALDLRDAVVGHLLVDLAGQLDELGRQVELARAPRQVERVDRQAVAAHARARARSA